MTEYLNLMLRAIVVYGFILLGIRVFGKRELSQLSLVDFVFILLISNAVQNSMVGTSTSLDSGLVVAGTLFILNFILNKLINRFLPFEKFIEGEPIMLIHNGIILTKNLKKAGFTMSELEAAMRENGIFDIEKVDLAMLEVDGKVSVLSKRKK